MTVLCNVSVFLIVLVLLGSHGTTLSRADSPAFATLSSIVVAAGAIAMGVHLLAVVEVPQHPQPQEGVEAKSDGAEMCAWLKRPVFYSVGWLYMSARLVVNLSAVYLPVYLMQVLGMHRSAIALVGYPHPSRPSPSSLRLMRDGVGAPIHVHGIPRCHCALQLLRPPLQ